MGANKTPVYRQPVRTGYAKPPEYYHGGNAKPRVRKAQPTNQFTRRTKALRFKRGARDAIMGTILIFAGAAVNFANIYIGFQLVAGLGLILVGLIYMVYGIIRMSLNRSH